MTFSCLKNHFNPNVSKYKICLPFYNFRCQTGCSLLNRWLRIGPFGRYGRRVCALFSFRFFVNILTIYHITERQSCIFVIA